jgi:hypothetical protein
MVKHGQAWRWSEGAHGVQWSTTALGPAMMRRSHDD